MTERERLRLAEGNGVGGAMMRMVDGETLTVDGVAWESMSEGVCFWWGATVDGWAVKLRQGHRGAEICEPLVWYWRLFCHDVDHEVDVYGGMESLEESMRAAVRFVQEVGSRMSMRE